MPYSSLEDERLTCMKEVFVYTIKIGKKAYSTGMEWKMFHHPKPYEGLKISVYSHTGIVTFLLAQGFQYVLRERFMQDILEDCFGHQTE